MARLRIRSDNGSVLVCELRLGTNRIGRTADNDLQIPDATVSGAHCEITFSLQGLNIRDCNSTNGTLVDGRPIQECVLIRGQVLRLGNVEAVVETDEVVVAIPKFEVARPAPPVVLDDGSVLCPRHPTTRATHQCTRCHKMMCDACVHYLRRQGGRVFKLCPLCSHKVKDLAPEKPKRRTLLTVLQQTIRLPWAHPRPPEGEEEEEATDG